MNFYIKHFGMWLGGASVLTILIGQVFYLPVLPWLIMIAGMIMAIVSTNKALGERMKFGPAFVATAAILLAKTLVIILLDILFWGTDFLSYTLEFQFLAFLAQLVYGTSFLLATGMWYMYEKAGKPGWAAIVPVYNVIVLCEMAEKPTWWTAIILLVPIANIVFMIMLLDALAKKFGKDTGFTVGLVLLGQIFMAVLGYGSAQYSTATAGGSNDLLDQ